MTFFRKSQDKIILNCAIKTNSKNQKVEFYEDQLVIWVKSEPQKGKANKEIIEYLSTLLNISKNSVSIVKGLTSTLKIIQISTENQNIMNSIIKKLNNLS